MDQPRRLTRGEVVRYLEATGLRALPHDAGHTEVLRAIVLCARMVQHAPINDVSMLYTEVVRFFEDRGQEAPWVTESIFFDPIMREIHGTCEREGEAPGAGPGQLVPLPGMEGQAGVAQPGGEQGGGVRGRSSRVEISVPPRDRSQEQEEGGAVAGPAAGGKRSPLPF